MLALTPNVLQSPAALASALGELADSLGLDAEPQRRDPSSRRDDRARLQAEGYAVLPSMLEATLAGRLAEGVSRLGEAGWPTIFIFAFDAPWAFASSLTTAISDFVGTPYELLADAWAWSIAPRARGWPPHRGGGSTRFERDAPELLTAWTALSDVSADRACMHVVPLDADPSYPASLDVVDAPLASVRAIPLGAGETVVWNANILHWGGACSPRAAGPRVSSSLSFGRVGARAAHGVNAVDPHLDREARIDFIARQILTYAPKAPEITPAVLEWARATEQLRAATEHFRGLSLGP